MNSQLLKVIQSLNNKKETDVSLEELDQILEENTDLNNFFSIQARIFELKCKLLLKNHDYTRWSFYSILCLSNNFISYLTNFQNDFFRNLSEIGKTDLPLIFNKSNYQLSEMNNPNCQLIKEEYDKIHHFSSPFQVYSYFTEKFVITDTSAIVKTKFRSTLPHPYQITQLILCFTIIHANRSDEELQIVLLPNDAHNNQIDSNTDINFENQILLTKEISAITIRQAILVLNNLRIILPSEMPAFQGFHKVYRVADSSFVQITVDHPSNGLVRVNFPLQIKLSLDNIETLPPYQIAIQILETNSKQLNYELNPGDEITCIHNVFIDSSKEQHQTIDVICYATSENVTCAKPFAFSIPMHFKLPFRAFTQCFDSLGNELMYNEVSLNDVLLKGEKYMFVTKFVSKAHIQLSIIDINIINNDSNKVEIELIPMNEKPLSVNKSEFVTVVMFVTPLDSWTEPTSIGTLALEYQVPDNENRLIFDYHLPVALCEDKIISVVLISPPFVSQYAKEFIELTIKNESEEELDLAFSIDNKDELMIDGFIHHSFCLKEKDQYTIKFSFVYLKTGQNTFPLMKITNLNAKVLWEATPNIFVMYASI